MPYIGEPANRDFYIGLWEKFGFSVAEEYSSNFFDIPDENFESEKAKMRLEEVKKKDMFFAIRM